MSATDLSKYDPTQVQLLEEQCILVNEKDERIGPVSKRESHMMNNINKGMLHRAFSVFLFNKKKELLLQQRATEKITFPDCWTNTCCSHPLWVSDELEEEGHIGVKRAAQRKLAHELGIAAEEVPLEDFKFLTRIHYKAASGDSTWGEHEIDYILFIERDVQINPNINEVKDYRFVSINELKDFISSANKNGVQLTPWFGLIANNYLWDWWENIDKIETFKDDLIHRLS
eukprot:TRINITY_DN2340_c0_g1_i1.p1 TRINITY_DN2340_c0_g1~~TRINITY_DN2340_c0_g1_i1.p1  ORF type:complete len:257 (-),score=45.38 TRINITY_DN2340_c0_g1_i1:24-710(-)